MVVRTHTSDGTTAVPVRVFRCCTLVGIRVVKIVLYIGFAERAGRGYGWPFTIVSVGYCKASSPTVVNQPGPVVILDVMSQTEPSVRGGRTGVWMAIIHVTGGKRGIFFLGLLVEKASLVDVLRNFPG